MPVWLNIVVICGCVTSGTVINCVTGPSVCVVGTPNSRLTACAIGRAFMVR